MRAFTSFSDVTNLLTKSCICVEYKDINKDAYENEGESFEDNMCEFDDISDVFADHLLMGKRLRKTLYAGNFNNLDEPPDHPPIALTDLALELFSKAVPNDGLDMLDMDYVSCTSEAARISPCAMIVAMIYLERLQLKNSDYLEIVSPSGLFVVTMLVASKFLFEDEEDVVTNQMWAEVLNFDVKELNNLERDFLAAIDWKILIDTSDYFNYLCNIERIIAIKQSSVRHWLSYSDICAILQNAVFETFWSLCLKKVMKTMALCTVGYVATALTLHTAGFAFYKLVQYKQDLRGFTDKNSVIEIEEHFHHVVGPSSYTLHNLSNTDEKSCLEIPLSLEILTEHESTVHKIDHDVCESSSEVFAKQVFNGHKIDHKECDSLSFKKKYLSSVLNRSKIMLLDKLKSTLNFYSTRKLLELNNSYSYNKARCKPSVTCFTLLM